MEIIAKCTFAAVLVSAVSLIIKKHNPELSMILSTGLSAMILAASFSMLNSFKELVNYAVDMLGASSTLVRPMLKCMGISYISKFGADICRDSSQNSAASALELAGTFCAAATAMPLVLSTLKLIGTLI